MINWFCLSEFIKFVKRFSCIWNGNLIKKLLEGILSTLELLEVYVFYQKFCHFINLREENFEKHSRELNLFPSTSKKLPV